MLTECCAVFRNVYICRCCSYEVISVLKTLDQRQEPYGDLQQASRIGKKPPPSRKFYIDTLDLEMKDTINRDETTTLKRQKDFADINELMEH
ncbi:hypothetical protein TNCT_200671 [Trichonephila clavata]|uniref:Uncharacterized protein n=1 Tax=Trichonephila clavata TaxID=2740835 RepID=A0A8X6F830_TRICU|nr:hypothetical protein TNCT_200671 [Trichonephila clavata]